MLRSPAVTASDGVRYIRIRAKPNFLHYRGEPGNRNGFSASFCRLRQSHKRAILLLDNAGINPRIIVAITMPKKTKTKTIKAKPQEPAKKAQSIRDCLSPLAQAALITSIMSYELSLSNPEDRKIATQVPQIMALTSEVVQKCNDIVANTQN